MSWKRLGLMICTLAIAGTSTAFAQGFGGRGRGGGPMGWPDSAALTTIGGEVVAVNTFPSRRGQSGVHIDLKSGDEVFDVHLGPSWFLDQKVKLEKGDRIEVTGAKTTAGGRTALIASQVKKGDTVVVLRDVNGIPAWSRRGRF